MVAKYLSLAVLLGSTGWVVADFGWEPSIAFITALSTFLVADRKSLVSKRTHASTSELENVRIRYFDLSSESGDKEFNDELKASIKNAKHEIYRSGRGFSEVRRDKKNEMTELIAAEEYALSNGVSINRIQTNDYVHEEWACRYSELLKCFPNIHVYLDLKNPSLVNIGIIDPREEYPVIQMLFESHEPLVGQVENYGSTAALFIYGARELAKALRVKFVNTINGLNVVGSDDLKRLGYRNYYFAYGTNMSGKQMLMRCPSAHKIGTGVLYGWELQFGVEGGHLNGTAAGIYKTNSNKDIVEGVIYAISQEDKEKLVRMESGGYQETNVPIKLFGDQQHMDAFTFIPDFEQERSKFTDSSVDHNILTTMLVGAKEHRLATLVERLERIKESVTQ